MQIPESVQDKRSNAYNKGRVFIHGASDITASAYKKQFQKDLAGFLRSRSAEMKSKGSMFLVCLGRTSVDPTDQGGAGLLFGTHFQDAWDDLVQEVIIFPIHIHFYECYLVCQIAHTTIECLIDFTLMKMILIELILVKNKFKVKLIMSISFKSKRYEEK